MPARLCPWSALVHRPRITHRHAPRHWRTGPARCRTASWCAAAGHCGDITEWPREGGVHADIWTSSRPLSQPCQQACAQGVTARSPGASCVTAATTYRCREVAHVIRTPGRHPSRSSRARPRRGAQRRHRSEPRRDPDRRAAGRAGVPSGNPSTRAGGAGASHHVTAAAGAAVRGRTQAAAASADYAAGAATTDQDQRCRARSQPGGPDRRATDHYTRGSA